jgi:hypothetical protein
MLFTDLLFVDLLASNLLLRPSDAAFDNADLSTFWTLRNKFDPMA